MQGRQKVAICPSSSFTFHPGYKPIASCHPHPAIHSFFSNSITNSYVRPITGLILLSHPCSSHFHKYLPGKCIRLWKDSKTKAIAVFKAEHWAYGEMQQSGAQGEERRVGNRDTCFAEDTGPSLVHWPNMSGFLLPESPSVVSVVVFCLAVSTTGSRVWGLSPTHESW